MSCERPLTFNQWKTFSEKYTQMGVWLWFVDKFIEDNCRLQLFSEFIHTEKMCPTSLEAWEQNRVWLFCYFNFERNLRYFKVKESILFVEQKRNGINYQFTHTLTRLILVTFKLLKALLTCTIIPWFLSSFDLPSYSSESRKKHTLRLLLMCLDAPGGGLS